MLCFAAAAVLSTTLLYLHWEKSREVPSVHRLLQKLEHVNLKALDRVGLQRMVLNCKNIIYFTHHCENIDLKDLEIMTLTLQVRHLAMEVQKDALIALAKAAQAGVSEAFRVGYISSATTNYEKLIEYASMLVANVDPGSQDAIEAAL